MALPGGGTLTHGMVVTTDSIGGSVLGMIHLCLRCGSSGSLARAARFNCLQFLFVWMSVASIQVLLS